MLEVGSSGFIAQKQAATAVASAYQLERFVGIAHEGCKTLLEWASPRSPLTVETRAALKAHSRVQTLDGLRLQQRNFFAQKVLEREAGARRLAEARAKFVVRAESGAQTSVFCCRNFNSLAEAIGAACAVEEDRIEDRF